MKFDQDFSREDASLYDEAIREYAARITARSQATYLVGNIRFPGLSDIDMLVVTDVAASDNNQFFAPRQRLPKRFHRLFLHEPFIVPADMPHIIARTSHKKRRLLDGRDVLAKIEPLSTREERWCKLLESVCNYAAYIDRVNAAGYGSGRLMTAVVNTMRFTLQDYDYLHDTAMASSFEANVDSARERLIHGADNPQSVLLALWHDFCATFGWLRDSLKRALPLARNEEIVEFAIRFLKGQKIVDDLDSQALVGRYEEVTRYYERLRLLKLSFGQLFYGAAYKDIDRRYHQPMLPKIAYRLWYRGARAVNQ